MNINGPNSICMYYDDCNNSKTILRCLGVPFRMDWNWSIGSLERQMATFGVDDEPWASFFGDPLKAVGSNDSIAPEEEPMDNSVSCSLYEHLLLS